MPKKITYRKVEIEVSTTHRYGYYAIAANYRNRTIAATTTDAEMYDYCDNDEPQAYVSQTAATKRMMACRRRAYNLIRERYADLY